MFDGKYIYSRLAPDSISQMISNHYDIGMIISCDFYVMGLHDNYLIKTENNKYIVRIYRNDWRTPDEVFFELELLNHLRTKEQSVSYPITTRNNDLAFEINNPEGLRLAALFSFAEGDAIKGEITTEHSELLGTTVAEIHHTADEFKTHHKRNELGFDRLVTKSLMTIKPYLNEQQYTYLKNIERKLLNKFSAIDSQHLNFGICIGDVNLTNFHISNDNKLTHFDFDQCGYAFRAFEIGKFAFSLYFHQYKQENLNAFIKGYETVRNLTSQEKEAIQYFELVAIIWIMSIRVDNKNKVGMFHLEKSYWIQRIAMLENLSEKLL